ncbi:FAD-binding protein [Nonomuraea glycinis]|uniref:FAD-binding monooxygenase n=1 Tax=Nonomuraea glycinis TaxID=2047744 RepID=A0A918ABN7_9ACTN|nr:FAD-binding protein [Nonomuraea glycinis]MCA2181138.1 FAD-binding protein [Nonomuraea glycinis]GGP13587.1 FAD-binding monooxygenase [Nonomuraea glycinis]
MHSPSGGRRHAVVLGAGMAGLLAARVLTTHFDSVTIVERDPLPLTIADRRGVTHGRRAHSLLARGIEVVAELFPGLDDEMVAHGGLRADIQGQGRWYNEGLLLRQAPSGLMALMGSRALLEGLVRNRVRALSGVEFIEEHEATGLISDSTGKRVVGVRVTSSQFGGKERPLDADLVIDATGRAARGPAWLVELGYEAPAQERVRVGLRYATRHFRRRPQDAAGDMAVVINQTDDIRRGGVMIAQENDRWLVTLRGYLDETPPLDLAGFLGFAASLPVPDIHEVIRDAEPIGEAVPYRFPASERRRYELLDRFPEGYLVIGDGICSFNPVYAQGMTVSALQAALLGECLGSGEAKLAPRFFEQAARINEAPWSVVVGGDMRYLEMDGTQTEESRQAGAFMAQVHLAASRDQEVARTVVRLISLVDGAEALQDPAFVQRVLRAIN